MKRQCPIVDGYISTIECTPDCEKNCDQLFKVEESDIIDIYVAMFPEACYVDAEQAKKIILDTIKCDGLKHKKNSEKCRKTYR